MNFPSYFCWITSSYGTEFFAYTESHTNRTSYEYSCPEFGPNDLRVIQVLEGFGSRIRLPRYRNSVIFSWSSRCLGPRFNISKALENQKKTRTNQPSAKKWIQYGGFRKWGYPTIIGFPTKNDHFGVFWVYPYFWKYPYTMNNLESSEIDLHNKHALSKPCKRDRKPWDDRNDRDTSPTALSLVEWTPLSAPTHHTPVKPWCLAHFGHTHRTHDFSSCLLPPSDVAVWVWREWTKRLNWPSSTNPMINEYLKYLEYLECLKYPAENCKKDSWNEPTHHGNQPVRPHGGRRHLRSIRLKMGARSSLSDLACICRTSNSTKSAVKSGVFVKSPWFL